MVEQPSYRSTSFARQTVAVFRNGCTQMVYEDLRM